MQLARIALALAVLCTASCKKKESVDDEPGPEIVDITVQVDTPESGTVSFRVVDAKQQPITPVANIFEIEVSSASPKQGCRGFVQHIPASAYVGPDKRATVTVTFSSRCEPPGELQTPRVVAEIRTGDEKYYGGGNPKIVFPDARPALLPELDAELAKLAELARTLPPSASPCTDVTVAAIDEKTPIESIELNHLLSLADAKPDGTVVLELASQLFDDLGAYRRRRVKESAKLFERLRATPYVVVVRVQKVTQPKLNPGSSFIGGHLEGVAFLVERASGQYRCAFPVVAHSSGSVELGDQLDALTRDFSDQLWKGMQASTAAVSPRFKLGAHADSLEMSISE